jgi:hypothetical protein
MVFQYVLSEITTEQKLSICDKSLPGGGEGGPGIAEGKERDDQKEEDNKWGNLW